MGNEGMGAMGYRASGTWAMGHMGNRVHGQMGTWVIGHMGITSLILEGSLQN